MSETAFVYKASFNAGALFNFDPVEIDISAEINYGNYTATFDYQPFTQARLDFQGDLSAAWFARATYRFE